MTMKLENYSGTADTFTLPYNSQAFDDSLNKFVEQKDYRYGFTYFGTTLPAKSRRSIIMTGHFSGASKSTHYQALSKHVSDYQLKKLYFSTDKFYIVIPQQVKKTNTGGRTNFIDYVASFTSPFGILFSDAQKSGGKTSAEDNEGNVFTLIEKIVTTSVTSGNTYEYKDKAGNGFKFTANATGTATIYLIYQVDYGNDTYMTEYIHCLIGSTKQVLALATEGKSMVLGLNAAETLNTRFNTGSASIPANTTFYFRHGYSGE